MISVIIPVYNTGQYLYKCINSIINQTYENLQIILVNDGSTDDSLSIMHEFENSDSRILVIDRIHEGVSAARNAGIEAAAGDYISFIDSDDWLALDTYQSLLHIMLEHEADAVYFEWTEEYEDGTSEIGKYTGKRKIIIDGEEIIRRYFRNDISLRISSGLLKTSLLNEVSFDIEREMGEDMLFSFLTLANAVRIVYVDLPFYHRFHRRGSLGNQFKFKRSNFGTATCTDIMVNYIQQNRPQLLQEAYIFSFNFYMYVLNYISYYKCEKEFLDIYNAIKKRLRELWRLIESPMKNLPIKLSGAYIVFLLSKELYHFCMVIYLSYVKRRFR